MDALHPKTPDQEGDQVNKPSTELNSEWQVEAVVTPAEAETDMQDIEEAEFEEVLEPTPPEDVTLSADESAASGEPGRALVPVIRESSLESNEVRLVGKYKLQKSALRELRELKVSLLSLMKQEVRDYFGRAEIMHLMYSKFATHEEGIGCLVTEFGFSDKHCENCLALHRVFGDQVHRFAAHHIPATVGYELAASSKELRETILQRFEAGEKLTVKDVVAIRKASRPKRKKVEPKPEPEAVVAEPGETGPSFVEGLDRETAIAVQETRANLLHNVARAAEEMDSAILVAKSGNVRLDRLDKLTRLERYCGAVYEQVTTLVRPLVTDPKSAGWIYASHGKLEDRGLVALMLVSKKLKGLQSLKIREETPWIIKTAAPILRWAAGRKVENIESAFEVAIDKFYGFEMLKPQKPAAE